MMASLRHIHDVAGKTSNRQDQIKDIIIMVESSPFILFLLRKKKNKRAGQIRKNKRKKNKRAGLYHDDDVFYLILPLSDRNFPKQKSQKERPKSKAF
jgi:hypothetical protein